MFTFNDISIYRFFYETMCAYIRAQPDVFMYARLRERVFTMCVSMFL